MALTVSVALGVVAMVSYGLSVVFSQRLSRQLAPAQFLFRRGMVVCAVLTVAALPGLAGLRSWPAAAGTVGLGVAGYGPVLAFTQGVKVDRLGVVAPVAGTSPLVTVLLSAAVLGVGLRPVQWVAIALVVAANVAVTVDPASWRRGVRWSGGVRYALAASLGWGLFFYFLVDATRALGPWLAAWLAEVGVTAAAGVHGRLAGTPTGAAAVLRPGIVVNGVLLSVGTAAFTVGVRYGNPGVVAALANSNALISTVVGAALFAERLTRLEWASAAVMLTGIVLITGAP